MLRLFYYELPAVDDIHTLGKTIDAGANKLAIESGAYFTGSCHMLDELTD